MDSSLRWNDEMRDAMADYETILVEQKGAVPRITLNRPQALNAPFCSTRIVS